MASNEARVEQPAADELVELARRIARNAHAGQYRRDGKTPYIEHPAAVASRAPKSAESQAAAWLHDVLEDTDVSRDDLLSQGIPAGVVEAVEALTKEEARPYEENLQRVARNEIARGVKIADMLSNLADSPTKKQILKYARGLLLLLEENE